MKCVECSCDMMCTPFHGFLSGQQLPAVCVSAWRQFKWKRKDAFVAAEEGQGETWATAAPSGLRGYSSSVLQQDWSPSTWLLYR